MQPHTFERIGIEAEFAGLFADHSGNHGHDFFEDTPAILNEQLIRQAFAAPVTMHPVIVGRGVVEEAKIIADIV